MNRIPSVNRLVVLLCLVMFVASPIIVPTSTAQNPGIELAVDTSIPNQDGVLVLYAGLNMGGEVGLPVGAGDITGDGRADVTFCAMYADAGPGTRRNNGQVNFYISDGRDSGIVDAFVQPPNVFTLVGAHSGDLLGTSVSARDVTGDGLGDVVVCASANDGPNQSRFNAARRTSCGARPISI